MPLDFDAALLPEPELVAAGIEYGYEHGWSDGLPLRPASRGLVDRFLAETRRSPDEVIGRIESLGRSCTVELAAVNAVMAGCQPEYFPLVLAAWDALMQERSASGPAWQSTSGPPPLIVVNGPVRARLGVNGAGGAFGPGFRANATVARAIGLIVRNAFGIHPQVLDQSTQGVPGRWSVCIGENEEESPWGPLAADGGLAEGVDAVSTILTRTYEYVDNRHTQDVEQLLWDFADTIARTGALISRTQSCGIAFSPEHAQMIAGAGYSKADVKAWFVQHCVRTEADLRRAGKDAVGEGELGGRSASPHERVPGHSLTQVLPTPDHVPIVVVGARNAAMSLVFRVFSRWSGTSVPVEQAAPSGAS